MRTWRVLRCAVLVVVVGLSVVAVPPGATRPTAAAPRAGAPDIPGEGQVVALRAGVQVAPKGHARLGARVGMVHPDPSRAMLPSLLAADYSGWSERNAARARGRMASSQREEVRRGQTGEAVPGAIEHDEAEPPSVWGTNDTQRTAERLRSFGTGRKDHAAVDVVGTIAGGDVPTLPLGTVAEDNGQLDRATPTGIDGAGRVRVSSVLGDGPHGTQPGADGNNDYDFYALTAGARDRITVTTRGSEVDTVVALYDDAGDVLGVNDEAGPGTTSSLLTHTAARAGTFYVLVAGFAPSGALPPDPHDSGSGFGDASTGAYRLDLSAVPSDTDVYRLDLAAGDVIGATVTGATSLKVFRPDGTAMVGSTGTDLSGEYPRSSPLPGGGQATVAYVAERAGAYALQVDGPPGPYRARVEAYRPGTEGRAAGRGQTILLDFGGGAVDTAPFGGPGERTLSPMRDFLAAWGLPRSKEKKLIKLVTAAVTENLRRDLARRGLNKRLSVTVTSKATGTRQWGRKGVSRVVVAGTAQEAGIDTIGVASTIDPGNFSATDSALVLLDTLSSTEPANEASINHYLRPQSDRLEFVARTIANVASHEAGHYIGSYHTDGQNSSHNLMDEGGSNFGANLYGVGPDGVGGTADDEDIDFGLDSYSRLEGYSGLENTLNVSAWAFVRRRR